MMFKLLKYFSTLLILSMVLAACGTSTEENPASGTTNEQVNESEEQPTETEDQINDETKDSEEKTNEESDAIEENTDSAIEEKSETPDNVNNNDVKSENNTEETTPASEIQISYSINGETVEEKASWTKSDNQAFGLYVLPGYELTAEEPGNDMLYFKENDLHWMRIQLLPGDSDWESLKENTMVQLEASLNTDVETVSPPTDFPKDTTVLQTKNDSDVVTAYLIKDQNGIIKLTISTQNQENYLDAFVQMAKHLKIQ